MMCTLSTLLGVGCGHVLEIEVEVIVPEEIGELYSKDEPGQLILRIDQPSLARTVALGQLCGKDTKGPRDIFTYDASGQGCPEPGTLSAWIADFDEDPICDRSDEWLDEDEKGPKKNDPQSTADFWRNTRCESVIDPFSLRLELPPE